MRGTYPEVRRKAAKQRSLAGRRRDHPKSQDQEEEHEEEGRLLPRTHEKSLRACVLE